MVPSTPLVFLLVLAAALSLSAGRTLQASDGVIWENSDVCFNPSDAFVDDDFSSELAYPLESVIDCLKSLKVKRDFAMESIQAYSDIFDLGYGYYNFDKNVLDFLPLQNPLNWEIFNGSSGGQVNYKRAFSDLKQMAQRNNGTSGLLSYQIADIILRARDAHSAPTGVLFDTIYLVQENNGPNTWLSLQKNGSKVNVIGNVMDNSTGDAVGTKIVSSINNINPLDFLKSLTMKTGIRKPCQFKSPANERVSEFDAHLAR